MPTLKKEPAPLKLADIRIQKLLAEHPETFRAAPLPRIDLREFQTELFKKQIDDRLGEGLKARNKNRRRERFRRANPVKQLPLIECRVIDTRKDSSGKKLYFELSNGQCVRADRIIHDYSETANVILRNIVTAEVDKNANRETTS